VSEEEVWRERVREEEVHFVGVKREGEGWKGWWRCMLLCCYS